VIRRGDLVVAAVSGDYEKPRPALVVQSDLFSGLPSVTICPMSGTLREDADLIRLTVEPSKTNGLQQTSQILVDKMTTVPLAKVGKVIGHAEQELMVRVNRAIALFLGIS
jgi:mRNA interferase MazF